MTMFVVFMIVFIGGPLVFWILTIGVPTGQGLRVLGVFTVVCALAGLALRYGMSVQWGQDFQVTAASLLMMWFAWIGALAIGVQALRRVDDSAGMRRLSGLIGTLGTTVPWFGLASARLMGA